MTSYFNNRTKKYDCQYVIVANVAMSYSMKRARIVYRIYFSRARCIRHKRVSEKRIAGQPMTD
jgi:hypothetical protein